MTTYEPSLLQYEITAEDGVFVARCLDIEVASDGLTESEAIENLKEALELYYEKEMRCDD